MNVQSPETPHSESLSLSSAASSSRHNSRKTKAEADNILAKIAKKMDEPTPPPQAKQQYDSFGEHVAEKLRNLPSKMAVYCQKIINDAIFMAETNNLDIDSRIVNCSRQQNDSMIEPQIALTTGDRVLYEAFVTAMGNNNDE